jgi:hypothetical protein
MRSSSLRSLRSKALNRKVREDIAKAAKKTKLRQYPELPPRCEGDAVQYNLQAV